MLTRRDPWVNMLRTTIAAFSAGLGGADAITVLPFTAALGLPDRFARRIARNSQILLLEESHLARVADPAAGAGGIEDLTAQICTAAWALFQEIEAGGGAAEALATGLIQRKVAKMRAERELAIARRTDALTGTSDFPDLAEAPVNTLDIKPAIATPDPTTVKFEPLPRIRLAEPFEQLREASDRVLAATGARPKAFLANLGVLADFNVRAAFAKTFFEIGGIEALTNEGFSSQENLAAAFEASGAKLACLCSSDEVYAKEAADGARALSAAGARHIYLAGQPQHEDALTAAGIGTFIFSGCDALAMLRAAHDILDTGGKSLS
jgi:methylmalonyl-CoA mutase